MNRKYIKVIIPIVVLLVLVFLCRYGCSPSLSGDLRDELTKPPVAADSLLPDRDMGYITLSKFADKVRKTGRCEIKQSKDSVEFIIAKEDQHIFYAGNSFEKLTKFKNLLISIKPNGSFTAKIYQNKNDTLKYINIPYQILFSLVKNTENSHDSSSPKQNDNKPKATIKSTTDLDYSGEKKLIQTEGLVFQNVTQILNKANTAGSKYAQVAVLWKYAYQNWNYINDPNYEQTGADTWRSAEQTIENYYLSGKPQKYSGDCDDFAILMASFARQIGLRSRFVCATDNSSGHAYAEFFVPNNEVSEMQSKLGNVNYFQGNSGIWVNMDWWGSEIGGTYFNGGKGRIKEIEDM